MNIKYFVSACLFFGSMTAFAGHHEGTKAIDHNSAKWQIQAFSSAAPGFLGDFATIIGTDGAVLREGTNGWICQSANPRPVPTSGWASAHEAMPACHDGEGMKWMMGYMQGKAPNMERDTFMWMLHGDMGEDNTKAGVLNEADAVAGQWIESGPHLMLMPKDPSTLAAYPTDFRTGAPYVMFPGTPYAHLMIPVTGYYDYQPESAPK